MILVTGVTGTIGRELCRVLLEASVPFRAMCRTDEQVQTLSVRGMEAVRGNFDDAGSLKRAMLGCQRLFLLAPGVEAQEARRGLGTDRRLSTRLRDLSMPHRHRSRTDR